MATKIDKKKIAQNESIELTVNEYERHLFANLEKLQSFDSISTGGQALIELLPMLTKENDSLNLFMKHLVTVKTEHGKAKKEILRIIGLAAKEHKKNLFSNLSRCMRLICKYLQENDSSLREACAICVGEICSEIVPNKDEGREKHFELVWKPLSDSMAEVNRNTQQGAALCLIEMIRRFPTDSASASSPSPYLEAHMSIVLARVKELLFNKVCFCAPQLMAALGTLVETIKQAALPHISTIAGFLAEGIAGKPGHADWNTRKAAAEALHLIGHTLRDQMAPFRAEILEILGKAKYDKIKPVRDAVAEATKTYQMWVKPEEQENTPPEKKRASLLHPNASNKSATSASMQKRGASKPLAKSEQPLPPAKAQIFCDPSKLGLPADANSRAPIKMQPLLNQQEAVPEDHTAPTNVKEKHSASSSTSTGIVKQSASSSTSTGTVKQSASSSTSTGIVKQGASSSTSTGLEKHGTASSTSIGQAKNTGGSEAPKRKGEGPRSGWTKNSKFFEIKQTYQEGNSFSEDVEVPVPTVTVAATSPERFTITPTKNQPRLRHNPNFSSTPKPSSFTLIQHFEESFDTEDPGREEQEQDNQDEDEEVPAFMKSVQNSSNASTVGSGAPSPAPAETPTALGSSKTRPSLVAKSPKDWANQSVTNESRPLSLHDLDPVEDSHLRDVSIDLADQSRDSFASAKPQLHNLSQPNSQETAKNFSDENNSQLLLNQNQTRSTINDTNSNEPNLNQTDANEISVNEANLNETNMNETNLNETNMNETNLNETNLNETNLNETNLNETNLNETNLNETNLNETNMNETNLNETNANNKTQLDDEVEEDDLLDDQEEDEEEFDEQNNTIEYKLRNLELLSHQIRNENALGNQQEKRIQTLEGIIQEQNSKLNSMFEQQQQMFQLLQSFTQQTSQRLDQFQNKIENLQTQMKN